MQPKYLRLRDHLTQSPHPIMAQIRLWEPSRAPTLFSKEIFSYVKEKALGLAFFLIPAKTIHSSPGPGLSPYRGARSELQPSAGRWRPQPDPCPVQPLLPALCLPWKHSPSADLHCREGLVSCLLAWLPLSTDAVHPKHWPQIWQGNLVSDWNLVFYQLAPLLEEAMDNSQLMPVAQHFCFLPGCFSSPFLSLSALPPSICPAPEPSACMSLPFQAIPPSKAGKTPMGIAHGDEAVCRGAERRVPGRTLGDTSALSLPPSQSFPAQHRHRNRQRFQTIHLLTILS